MDGQRVGDNDGVQQHDSAVVSEVVLEPDDVDVGFLGRDQDDGVPFQNGDATGDLFCDKKSTFGQLDLLDHLAELVIEDKELT